MKNRPLSSNRQTWKDGNIQGIHWHTTVTTQIKVLRNRTIGSHATMKMCINRKY